MQFTIELLNVSKTTVPTAKGSYISYEVAYKKDGKVEGKKIMSFVAKEVCKILDTATAGTVFTVTSEKNEKGYWDWKTLTTGAAPAETYTPASTSAAKTTPKGDWETREERAYRQVLIVKQSCLAQAVHSLKTDKVVAHKNDVIKLAEDYLDWVMAKPDTQQAGAKSDFSDLADDIPF